MLDAEGLRSLPLFAALDDAQVDRVLRSTHEHHASAGEPIVEQWQVSRDLYVVLDGAVAVSVDGNLRGVLGQGDFFGEIAAIEWGAGYARTRTATVTATMPTRLLVLDWMLVNELMKAEPEFRARLERTSHDASRRRLTTSPRNGSVTSPNPSGRLARFNDSDTFAFAT